MALVDVEFYAKKVELLNKAFDTLNATWDAIYECQEIETRDGDPDYAVEFGEIIDEITSLQSRIENEIEATQAMVDMGISS